MIYLGVNFTFLPEGVVLPQNLYQVLVQTKVEREFEVRTLTEDDKDTEEKLVSESNAVVQDTAKRAAHNETWNIRLEKENR